MRTHAGHQICAHSFENFASRYNKRVLVISSCASTDLLNLIRLPRRQGLVAFQPMARDHDPVGRGTIPRPNVDDIADDQVIDMQHHRPSRANDSHLTIGFLHQVS